MRGMKKIDKQQVLSKVVISAKHTNPPQSHEVEAAQILAQHFCCDVEFLVPVDDYMRKTADISMLGAEWEIKSPIGNSKSTIGNQFRTASKQSRNIIIDARRTPLDSAVVIKSIRLEMKKRKTIKRVILIDKSKKVLAITP